MTGNATSARKIRILRRLLQVTWQHRGRALLVFALQGGVLSLTLASYSLAGLAVDVVRQALGPNAPGPRWPGWLEALGSWQGIHALGMLAALVALAATTRAALEYAYSVQSGRLVHLEIVPSLRVLAHRNLLRLGVNFFAAHTRAGLINRLTRDVQLLRSFVDGVALQGAVTGLALVIFLLHMLETHVALTLACLATTPLLWLVARLFSRRADPAYRESRQLSDRMVRGMCEGVEGISVVRALGRQQAMTARFNRQNRAVREQQQSIFRLVSRFVPGIDFLSQLNLVVLLAYGSGLVANGTISLGDLVVFAGLLQQFATRVSSMANIVNTLQQSLAGARRVFEVLDAEPEVRDVEVAAEAPDEVSSLCFRDVSFAYPDSDPCLRNIDFELRRGQRIGIVGATGSGKSTLLGLVQRFVDPSSGSIELGGVDIRKLPLGDLRQRVGSVFQETLLFRDSIERNIAFGAANADTAQVLDAARAASIAEFIQALPEQYRTLVEEGGANLSGGQRQRIALARALLPAPDILLLDEPTAAVDADTERSVIEAVLAATAGKSALIVSSRAALLAELDEVLVLDRGRIAERGKPEVLATSGGLYQMVVELERGTMRGAEPRPDGIGSARASGDSR